MKIRNKKTGEIATLTLSSNGEELLFMKNNEMVTRNVKLSDLEEWEDAPEEPKEYWFIRDHTSIVGYAPVNNSDAAKYRKEIVGNYFETKEEAEKAVEKLKAWKRLKDKGFRFNNFVRDAIYYEISDEEIEKEIIRNDLNLLFGGEE